MKKKKIVRLFKKSLVFCVPCLPVCGDLLPASMHSGDEEALYTGFCDVFNAIVLNLFMISSP
jgi:hypothetical protein